MNIGEILKTKRWKVLMNYAYSWGASLVIIGALFKLQHWNHAGVWLSIGLLTEAFIFFISAFEPPLEQPDWTRVYPELQDDYELLEPVEDIQSNAAKGNLETLLSNTNISPELLGKIGKSLNDLSNTASGISDISSATLATDIYVRNLNSASESMIAFSEVNVHANNVINNSIGELANAYSNTAHKISEAGENILSKLNESSVRFTKQIDESGSRLSDSYQRFSGALDKGFKDFELNTSSYGENLHKLNKNIELLNISYEKQLKGTSDQLHASTKFFEELNQMNQIIASSVQEMKKYKENAEKLNSHLDALNSVYGNMLGAMNYKKK
jgi:gliding motility-associated protein GldL